MLRETRIWQTAKAFFGRNCPGRAIHVYPDDLFIVSYPRSGNTWARFLIGNLRDPDRDVTFSNIDDVIPDIYKTSRSKLSNMRRPRILKSHEYFDPRYKKILYVVRDPRDVAVSYYHFCLMFHIIDENMSLDRYVDRFIAGDIDGYGSWGENVGSWLGAANTEERFLLLRYEDLHEQTEACLRKMAGFLGISYTDDSMNRAISLASAERMRELERPEREIWNKTHRIRTEESFVRMAQPGDWRTELSQSSAQRIERAWGNLMRRMGYIE